MSNNRQGPTTTFVARSRPAPETAIPERSGEDGRIGTLAGITSGVIMLFGGVGAAAAASESAPTAQEQPDTTIDAAGREVAVVTDPLVDRSTGSSEDANVRSTGANDQQAGIVRVARVEGRNVRVVEDGQAPKAAEVSNIVTQRASGASATATKQPVAEVGQAGTATGGQSGSEATFEQTPVVSSSEATADSADSREAVQNDGGTTDSQPEGSRSGRSELGDISEVYTGLDELVRRAVSAPGPASTAPAPSPPAQTPDTAPESPHAQEPETTASEPNTAPEEPAPEPIAPAPPTDGEIVTVADTESETSRTEPGLPEGTPGAETVLAVEEGSGPESTEPTDGDVAGNTPATTDEATGEHTTQEDDDPAAGIPDDLEPGSTVVVINDGEGDDSYTITVGNDNDSGGGSGGGQTSAPPAQSAPSVQTQPTAPIQSAPVETSSSGDVKVENKVEDKKGGSSGGAAEQQVVTTSSGGGGTSTAETAGNAEADPADDSSSDTASTPSPEPLAPAEPGAATAPTTTAAPAPAPTAPAAPAPSSAPGSPAQRDTGNVIGPAIEEERNFNDVARETGAIEQAPMQEADDASDVIGMMGSQSPSGRV